MNTKLIYACLLFCLTNYVVGYTVSGNQLYGPNGGSVRLRGIDRPSFEWSATGESASLADYQLMANWGFNVVRVAMNQDFWLSGSSTYSSGYRSVIAQQVAWIKQCGMGVILDLHWSDQGNLQISGGAAQQVMADTNSITFWTQVATAYKNDPWVMFELYNEPHDVSWSIWRDGGSSNGFTVAGMQQLYNAVRATGANNVVLVCGLNWAFDLSGVSNGYALTGTNIAYATHPYDYDGKQAANWDAAFGNLAATYPIVMTEFGQYCYNDGYVSTLLAYAERKGIHWTAWAWYPGGCSFPAIIADWSGTPTSPVGALVKSYLTSSSTSSSSSSTSGATTKPATGATSAPTSAPATSAPATSGSTIFDNGLASGWSDWSWATRSLTNTNPVYSGSYSISFTLSNYGGIYFHSSSGISVGSYSTLQFYTNGPSANIQVKLYDASGPIGNALSLPSSSSSGSWTLQSVPLSSFGLSSTTQFYGVVIIYNSGGSGGTMYIDKIVLGTSSSSSPATAAPTTKPATAAPATAAPTTKPATAAPTTKPSTPATSAPATSAPATSPPSTGSGCSASSVKVTQSLSSTWTSGSDTVYQYNLAIQNTCSTKTLSSVTLSVSGWHPANFWNLQVSGTNTLTTASYVTVAPSSTYSSAGYQNIGGPATFTVTSATFQ